MKKKQEKSSESDSKSVGSDELRRLQAENAALQKNLTGTEYQQT